MQGTPWVTSYEVESWKISPTKELYKQNFFPNYPLFGGCLQVTYFVNGNSNEKCKPT